MDRDPLLAPFLAAPERSAVLTDFDGTLSPIVADPAAARPFEGVVEVLAALVARYARVAVISGRPVAFLEPQVPAGVWLSGLYGLERSVDGVRSEEVAGEWRSVVAEAADASERGAPEGVWVERKGLSLTLHYRGRPELVGELRAWADREAARAGLVAHAGKMSVELRPPSPIDKGTVVEELAAGFEAVCFLGDDLGDLPALAAIDRLAGRGVHGVKIAVRTSETPAAVLDTADLVVDGPAGAVALLRTLL